MATYHSVSKDGTPVKIKTTVRDGQRVTKITSAGRRRCDQCSKEYWAWGNHPVNICAVCLAENPKLLP